MIRTFFAAIHLFLKQEGRALLQILVAHGICYPLAGKSGQQCPKESPLGDLYKLFIKEEERQNQQKLQITYFVIDKQKNRNYDLTTGKPEDAETPGERNLRLRLLPTFELYERNNLFLAFRGEAIEFDQEIWRWSGGGLFFFTSQ